MNSSSSEDEEPPHRALQRRAPKFRERLNWENLSRSEFVERFRMTPTQAEKLLLEIGQELEPLRFTNHALTSKQKFCVAMRFFGTNSPLFEIGDSEHISKATAFRLLPKLLLTKSITLNGPIMRTVVVSSRPNFFENLKDDLALFLVRSVYFNSYCVTGFVNCCGAIDGSLFTIVAPSTDEHLFVDRKGRHSLNAQGVCGADLKLYSFSVNFPGSVNDARVFRRSGLYRMFESGFRPFRGAVIVGDAAYPSSNFLVPMRTFGGQWAAFYEAHARARSSIENCWALLKNRFCCLKGPLRLKEPTDSAHIIKCLALVHNFLLENKEENDKPAGIEDPIDAQDDDEDANLNQHEDMNRAQILLNQFNVANNL